MTSLYHQSIPILIKYLKNLSGLINKTVTHADAKGMKHEDILAFRLYEDMRPITYQVQSCSNTAKFLAHRVGGIENIYLDDKETTFAELQDRITRTIEILNTVDAATMDANAKKEVVWQTSLAKLRFDTGEQYVNEYTIPFFHFHMTTAYCIVRHLGVPVGALDYMADVFVKEDGSVLGAK